MNFKKKVSGSWTDTPHYIHNTSTDTITTLPAVIHPTGTTATVGLKGQTVQSSIPSPTSPIMPQGTGERTGNLFNDFDIVGQVPSVNNGNLVNSALGGTTSFIKMGSAEIVLSYNVIANIYLFLYDNDSQFIGYIQETNGEPIYSTSISGYSNAAYCRVRVDNLENFSNANIMLNTGSTALPYELYGYKIPISSANTTTPVYLGEVQTTRAIKKLVLTGEEAYTKQSGTTLYSYNLYRGEKAQTRDLIMCSHLPFSWSYSTTISIHIYSSLTTIFLNFGTDVMNAQPSGNTVAGLKEYLAAQYTAGTPVTIWYVLATEETAVVNEPLMKIDDYADTVSGISIPVTTGGDTLSVGTTVQPSEVTVNYKGWHPVADVHERDNGAWT